MLFKVIFRDQRFSRRIPSWLHFCLLIPKHTHNHRKSPGHGGPKRAGFGEDWTPLLLFHLWRTLTSLSHLSLGVRCAVWGDGLNSVTYLLSSNWRADTKGIVLHDRKTSAETANKWIVFIILIPKLLFLGCLRLLMKGCWLSFVQNLNWLK